MPRSGHGEVGPASLRSGRALGRSWASNRHVAGSTRLGIICATSPRVPCRSTGHMIVSASPPASAGVSSIAIPVARQAMSPMPVVTPCAPITPGGRAGRSPDHGTRVADPDAGMASFIPAAPRKAGSRSRSRARRVRLIHMVRRPAWPPASTRRVAGPSTTVRQRTGPPDNAGSAGPAPDRRAVASRPARPSCHSTGHGIAGRRPDQTAGTPRTHGGEP